MKLAYLTSCLSLYLAYEIEVKFVQMFTRPGTEVFNPSSNKECSVLPENWRTIEWDDLINIHLYDNINCEGDIKKTLEPTEKTWEMQLSTEDSKLKAFRIEDVNKEKSGESTITRDYDRLEDGEDEEYNSEEVDNIHSSKLSIVKNFLKLLISSH
ncbi:hypothetical protein CONCODRAFT_80769 [Conidiobolus coronatus NRRL 28638]|uniref:Uncharacterized protein n=1 Tax=Conidiobolus coronatus (strain ATCC 28846 / CBS 209.66 / NRRL 28638) TaxID=796925 RepID=A0A137NRQ9_CONC2|nr:hypothetical protein CONCODRAFT_80769 [Conidiobolus coronatus NRRL 28638]|eukprot:KXN65449.1 hypothetical protein CONCODRAFT_80769 [Conidiobolus coronatus NRRL 28638]